MWELNYSEPFWDQPGAEGEGEYDKIYLLNRDTRSRQEVRDFVQNLWTIYAPFCGDRKFLAEARRHFNQFTWQMYVGVCLLEAGHDLERAGARGPDHKVLIANRRLWVECIAPEPGVSNNEAKRTYQQEMPASGLYRPPPDDKIALRLTGAIWEKTKKYQAWVEDGVVSPADPYIIAVGAGVIPDADLEEDFPRIVRILYGLGESVIRYRLDSNEPPEIVPTYKDAVLNANGKPVSMRGFLDNDHPEVSAVIFSGRNVWNPPRRIGRDLVTVYSPVATNRLEPGTIPVGREYWATDIVNQRDNREDLPEPEVDEELRRMVESASERRKSRSD
jgi:hypothetical protein